MYEVGARRLREIAGTLLFCGINVLLRHCLGLYCRLPMASFLYCWMCPSRPLQKILVSGSCRCKHVHLVK